MYIGIISYYPQNDTKEKRKQVHKLQVDWLRSIYGINTEIHVVAQGYMEEDYLPDINYMKAEKPLGGSIARNWILKDFYSTDEDYLLIMDDDTITYPYYDMNTFLLEFKTNPQKYIKDIDMAVATYPAYFPFKKSIYEDKNNLSHYKFIKKPHVINMSIMFLKNLKKYYDKELYFDEKIVLPPDFELTMEDTDFGLNCILSGLKCYRVQCLIAKCPNWNISTIYKDENKRLEKNKFSIEYLIEKYKSFGMKRREYGRMDAKFFDFTHNKAKAVLYIKREQPITFSENEIPKDVKIQNTKGRLFQLDV